MLKGGAIDVMPDMPTVGAGPILTSLAHEIDTLRHLLSDIVSVQAECSNAIRRREDLPERTFE